MKSNKTYRYLQDPGHGWMAVKISELEYLGIQNEISSYSYKKGKTAYLEEDCDMPKFVKAFNDTFGFDPKIVEKNVSYSCAIRTYLSYKEHSLNTFKL